jgi:hypothetical protein
MTNDFQLHLESVDDKILVPLVRQVLRNDAAEIISWNSKALSGGYASETVGGYGTYLFEGTARANEETVSWSLVLKVLGKTPEAGSDNPQDWNYWKREILAYQSSLLADLPRQFSAPRCFGVVEYPNDEFWIWLEGITDVVGKDWPLKQYGIAARHLGQFNGFYLLGHPLPNYSWLTEGRVKNWLDIGEPTLRDLRSIVHNAPKQPWLSNTEINRILALWADRNRLVAALEQLPRTFCHHDAFRRNLFAQKTADGLDQTVAVDWQIVGTGALGEEITPLIAVSLQFMDVEMRHAQELEDIVFKGYLAGLGDVGCRIDERLVRFGYTASAALMLGVAGSALWLPIIWDDKERSSAERVIGYPIESILDTFADLQKYLLELGEEAQRLVDYVQ